MYVLPFAQKESRFWWEVKQGGPGARRGLRIRPGTLLTLVADEARETRRVGLWHQHHLKNRVCAAGGGGRSIIQTVNSLDLFILEETLVFHHLKIEDGMSRHGTFGG